MELTSVFRGFLGIFLILLIAWFFSSDRSRISYRLVFIGLFFQCFIAVLINYVDVINDFFFLVSEYFVKFLNFGLKGAEFLYGDLAKNSNVVEETNHSLGFLFIFQVLPNVIFFSTVTAGLYYLGILQKIVFVFAWLMSKTMRLSGAESLSVAGNVFLGQTEAPLLVRPFIAKMTKSELNCLMTGGMATIAGSVLGAYVSFLGGGDPEQQQLFATYLLSASIMNAPAAIVISKIFHPEKNPDEINKNLTINTDDMGVNLIDALARGASDGMKLAINIAAMLLAFIGIVFVINAFLMDVVGDFFGLNEWVRQSTNNTFTGFSLEYILGQIFRIFAFIMGVEWKDTIHIGSLLGQKIVINEFIAYLNLADLKANGVLSNKSIVIATYSLCGFANFSSIAIQIAGIGGMAPNKQSQLSELGIRALIAASLATMMTATIAGILFV